MISLWARIDCACQVDIISLRGIAYHLVLHIMNVKLMKTVQNGLFGYQHRYLEAAIKSKPNALTEDMCPSVRHVYSLIKTHQQIII